MFCLPFECKWRKTCTFVTYLIAVFLFTAAGAAVFMLLEEGESYRSYKNFEERCQHEKVNAVKEIEDAINNSSVSLNVSQAIKQAINRFDACHRRRSNDSTPEVFHYFDSVMYAISVHSTVGYGPSHNTRPSSNHALWHFGYSSLHGNYIHGLTQRSPFKKRKLDSEPPTDEAVQAKQERRLKFYQSS
uniref:Potassium channel domain-containing protein n=1 Tax=Ditylenchus dipsaci TaxID=166011 RepID=A0A915DU40_9BILA